MLRRVTHRSMALAIFGGGLGSLGRSTVLLLVGLLLLGYGVFLFTQLPTG